MKIRLFANIWKAVFAPFYLPLTTSLGVVEERRAEKGDWSLFYAAQKQAITTNSVKHDTSMTSETLLCRLCNGNVESVRHIISACLNMKKNQDLKR